MAEDNKLGRKITTLREAHHLTCQDLSLIHISSPRD